MPRVGRKHAPGAHSHLLQVQAIFKPDCRFTGARPLSITAKNIFVMIALLVRGFSGFRSGRAFHKLHNTWRFKPDIDRCALLRQQKR